jgi:putative transcriptional regulator
MTRLRRDVHRLIGRLCFGAAALLAAAAGMAWAEQPGPHYAQPMPHTVSHAGALLVARPEMSDPRFARAVIFLVRHNADGAMGLVVNKPVEHRPVAQVLKDFGIDGVAAKGDIDVHYGGPVQLELAFVLHTPDYRGPDTVIVNDNFAMTADPQILRDIAAGKGPKKSILARGYAGWGPGQLEGELALRAWEVVPADPELVFGGHPEDLWERAIKRRGVDL